MHRPYRSVDRSFDVDRPVHAWLAPAGQCSLKLAGSPIDKLKAAHEFLKLNYLVNLELMNECGVFHDQIPDFWTFSAVSVEPFYPPSLPRVYTCVPTPRAAVRGVRWTVPPSLYPSALRNSELTEYWKKSTIHLLCDQCPKFCHKRH